MGLWTPNRRADNITPVSTNPFTWESDSRYAFGTSSKPEGVAFAENTDKLFFFPMFYQGRNPMSVNVGIGSKIYIKGSGRLGFGTQLKDIEYDTPKGCIEKNYLYRVRGSIHDRIATSSFRMRWWIGLRDGSATAQANEWVVTTSGNPKIYKRGLQSDLETPLTDANALNIEVLQYFGGEDEGHQCDEHVLTQGRDLEDGKVLAFGVEFINQTSSTKIITDLLANLYMYRYEGALAYNDFAGGG